MQMSCAYWMLPVFPRNRSRIQQDLDQDLEKVTEQLRGRCLQQEAFGDWMEGLYIVAFCISIAIEGSII